MNRRIKGSQLLRVPYGSHCTQLDLPDFVNLRIERFLEEIGYK
jgi:pimeloyl-ACP methyl ester carboxylesterase